MTNQYDVPAEMRDFAERSVAQARKAFEGFIGAVQKAAETVESTPGVPATAKETSAKAISYAEKNVTAALDLAEKLVHAKDPQEVLKLQTEFVQAQMASIQEQTKDLGETMGKAIGLNK
jgi:phasin